MTFRHSVLPLDAMHTIEAIRNDKVRVMTDSRRSEMINVACRIDNKEAAVHFSGSQDPC